MSWSNIRKRVRPCQALFSLIRVNVKLCCKGICYSSCLHLSRPMGKQTICICENKDADQLRGNREADQRLCFRYSDSTILFLLYLNPKFQASSSFLCLYRPVCVRKPHCWFSHEVAVPVVFPVGHTECISRWIKR